MKQTLSCKNYHLKLLLNLEENPRLPQREVSVILGLAGLRVK
jgi:hypothetical protein